MDDDNPNRPKLQNWTISKLSLIELKLKLNFTNVLFVSSTYDQDIVNIVILEPYRFRSISDNQYLEVNYSISSYLP